MKGACTIISFHALNLVVHCAKAYTWRDLKSFFCIQSEGYWLVSYICVGARCREG